MTTHHENVPGCQASQTPGDDSPAPDLDSSPLPQDAAGWEKDHSAAPRQTLQEQPRRVINTRNHRATPSGKTQAGRTQGISEHSPDCGMLKGRAAHPHDNTHQPQPRHHRRRHRPHPRPQCIPPPPRNTPAPHPSPGPVNSAPSPDQPPAPPPSCRPPPSASAAFSSFAVSRCRPVSQLNIPRTPHMLPVPLTLYPQKPRRPDVQLPHPPLRTPPHPRVRQRLPPGRSASTRSSPPSRIPPDGSGTSTPRRCCVIIAR